MAFVGKQRLENVQTNGAPRTEDPGNLVEDLERADEVVDGHAARCTVEGAGREGQMGVGVEVVDQPHVGLGVVFELGRVHAERDEAVRLRVEVGDPRRAQVEHGPGEAELVVEVPDRLDRGGVEVGHQPGGRVEARGRARGHRGRRTRWGTPRECSVTDESSRNPRPRRVTCSLNSGIGAEPGQGAMAAARRPARRFRTCRIGASSLPCVSCGGRARPPWSGSWPSSWLPAPRASPQVDVAGAALWRFGRHRIEAGPRPAARGGEPGRAAGHPDLSRHCALRLDAVDDRRGRRPGPSARGHHVHRHPEPAVRLGAWQLRRFVGFRPAGRRELLGPARDAGPARGAPGEGLGSAAGSDRGHRPELPVPTGRRHGGRHRQRRQPADPLRGRRVGVRRPRRSLRPGPGVPADRGTRAGLRRVRRAAGGDPGPERRRPALLPGRKSRARRRPARSTRAGCCASPRSSRRAAKAGRCRPPSRHPNRPRPTPSWPGCSTAPGRASCPERAAVGIRRGAGRGSGWRGCSCSPGWCRRRWCATGL